MSYFLHHSVLTTSLIHNPLVAFFFCLCNLVYEHLLCNNLRFIGGVCQHLAGRNHADGSRRENAACLLLLPVCASRHIMVISAKHSVILRHATSQSRCLFITSQSHTVRSHAHTYFYSCRHACFLT